MDRTADEASNFAKGLRDHYGVELWMIGPSYGSEYESAIVTIESIVVPKDNRRKGVGSDVMFEVIRWADKNNYILALSPSADFGGKITGLKRFYKRFGFVPNKGRNKDFRTAKARIRYPKVKKIGIRKEVEIMSSDKKGFWDEFIDGFSTKEAAAIDGFLDGGKELNGPQFTSVREVAEGNKKAASFQAGSRVAFERSLEAQFSYEDIPPEDVKGTVVAVRTAHGTATIDPMSNRVFALWDDGKVRSFEPRHLERLTEKQAANYRIVVADRMDLSALFYASGEDLVHKATENLWSLKQGEEGFVLERLFSEDGKPLKV